jgi:hypothetical protein
LCSFLVMRDVEEVVEINAFDTMTSQTKLVIICLGEVADSFEVNRWLQIEFCSRRNEFVLV